MPGSWQVSEFDSEVEFQGQSGQAVVEVAAGSETVYLCAVVVGDVLVVLDAQVTSIWSATGTGSALSGGPLLAPDRAEALFDR